MNKKRKGIKLRKLYSLGEDVMIGADLGSSAALLQDRREAGGGMAEADTGLASSDGGCLSQSPPPLRRLLLCAIAGSVESKGVESDKELDGDGRAASNIGSATAQVCKNN
jgi:hypothetical protein